MKTICVFYSANEVGEKYCRDANALVQLIVKDGYSLIWGDRIRV